MTEHEYYLVGGSGGGGSGGGGQLLPLPTIDAGPDAAISEGDTFVQVGSFTDLRPASATATVDFGDGSGGQTLALNTDQTFNLSHPYTDNGVYIVTVTLTGDSGMTATDNLQVTVSNLVPSVSPGGDSSQNEGKSFMRSGSVADPGADTWTATVDYGDATGAQPLALNPDRTFALDHLYTDSGTFTVSVIVTDDDGESGTASFVVAVSNIAPSVSAGPGATVGEGIDSWPGYQGAGSFTDPGADTWTGTVDYGDGTGAQPLTLNPDNTFALDHLYDDNGTYTVLVTVTDDDGGSGTASFVVTVTNLAPTATFAVPGQGTVGVPVTFGFIEHFWDSSSADRAAGFRYSFDVNDNGSFTDPGDAADVLDPLWSVTFDTAGTHTLRGRIKDKDGGFTDYQGSIVIS